MPLHVARRLMLLCSLPVILAACSSNDSSSRGTTYHNPWENLPPDDGGTVQPGPEGGADAEPDAAAETGPGTPGFFVRFDPSDTAGEPPPFLGVPFPSDLYVDSDGTLVDSWPGLERLVKKASQAQSLARQLGTLRGFGTSGGSLFELLPENPTVDKASVPSDETACGQPGSGAFLVDLDASSAPEMLVPCEAFWHDSREFTPSTNFLPPALTVKPARGIKLREGHRHAAILTSAIHDQDQHALEPSPAFKAVRDGQDRASDAAKMYGDAVDAIAQAGLPGLDDKSTWAGMSLYTTGNAIEEMLEARAAVVAEPVPAIDWSAAAVAPMGTGRFNEGAAVLPGFDATLDDAMGTPPKTPSTYFLGEVDDPASYDDNGLPHDGIGAMATGVFEAPNLLIRGDDTYSDPLEGTFFHDGSAIEINPSSPLSKIWVTITIPKTPPPAAGYPVIIFQHGISRDRWDMVSGINDWAHLGFATVAIDVVAQGARAPETMPEAHVDQTNRYQGPYDGPDGLPDVVVGDAPALGNLVGIAAIRDQLRQSALDIVTLIRVIQSAPDLGPLAEYQPGAKLDGSRIELMTVSLGGMVATSAVAISPEIQNVVMSTSGASLGQEVLPGDGYDSGLLFGGFASGWGILGMHLDRGATILPLIQHILDPADPMTFAPLLHREPPVIAGVQAPSKNVLLLQVVDDDVVWNGANDALARGVGAALARPNVGVSVPLSGADPDQGVFHDVPTVGHTVLCVQQGPAGHAQNFYGPERLIKLQWPYPRFDETQIFAFNASPAMIPQPYLSAHEMVGTFLSSALTGVPRVTGVIAPRRDYDDDGVDDDVDPDPNDPSVK